MEATLPAPSLPISGADVGSRSRIGSVIRQGIKVCMTNPIVAGIVAATFPRATGGCDDDGKCSDQRDDDDDGDDFCDERLAIELATCRALGNAERRGRVPPGSAAICYESAQARYWACKNKRPDPPFHGWPQH